MQTYVSPRPATVRSDRAGWMNALVIDVASSCSQRSDLEHPASCRETKVSSNSSQLSQFRQGRRSLRTHHTISKDGSAPLGQVKYSTEYSLAWAFSATQFR